MFVFFLWKRCWHVLQQTVCKPCLAMSSLRTGSDAGMFRFGPTWEEAMCMFDRSFVDMFYWNCLAMCHLRAMCSFVATLVYVARIAAKYLPESFYARTMHLSLAVLALTYCNKVCCVEYRILALVRCFMAFSILQTHLHSFSSLPVVS